MSRPLTDQDPSPSGRYRVRLHFDGQWQTLTLDDQFPVKAELAGTGDGVRTGA